MADSENVLEQIDVPNDVEIIGIVVNEKGAGRAICHPSCFNSWLSLLDLRDLSAQKSESDARRMLQSSGIDQENSRTAELNTVAYISMAFGNPYGDPWGETQVSEAMQKTGRSRYGIHFAR